MTMVQQQTHTGGDIWELAEAAVRQHARYGGGTEAARRRNVERHAVSIFTRTMFDLLGHVVDPEQASVARNVIAQWPLDGDVVIAYQGAYWVVAFGSSLVVRRPLWQRWRTVKTLADLA